MSHTIVNMTTYAAVLAAEVRAEAARQRRTAHNLAVAVQEQGGDSRAKVTRMISGERPFSIQTLSEVAQLLDVSAATLVARADDAWQQVKAESRCTLPSDAPGMSSQVSGLSMAAA